MLGDAGAEGTRGREYAEGEVVVRSWQMPVLAAILCVSVWPLTGAVLLAAVFAAFGDLPSADLVLGGGVILLCLGGIVCAVRAVRARVVVDAETVRVQNVLSTRQLRWADIEAVEEATSYNVWALGRPWRYGTTIRVRGRRRPVGVLALWHPDEDHAAALRRQVRAPTTDPEPTPPNRP
jgi:hypothetical protein